jgi:hypothetical protein
MKRSIFLSLIFVLISFFHFAQTVSIIGTFTNWLSDVNMNSTDNTNWMLTYTFTATEQLKFRQNASRTVNWGNSSFPSGSGVQDGADIPVPAGTYTITTCETLTSRTCCTTISYRTTISAAATATAT